MPYRLLTLKLVLVLVGAVMIGRLAQLQLVNSEARRYGGTLEVTTTRYVTVPPRRGEILARDRATLLAESVPIYSIALSPGALPPSGSVEREQVLGRVAQVAALTSTLTISPATTLQNDLRLRRALRDLVAEPLPDPRFASRQAPLPDATPALSVTLTVPPANILRALDVTAAYSEQLTLENPLETVIANSDVRRYESVVVKDDVPYDLALAIRENSSYLPGVNVIEGYRRRYPQSGEVPSLSHLLGYAGRINECELIIENPATSWLDSLLSTVNTAPNCGLVRKTIVRGQIGLAPYQRNDRIGKDGLEAGYEAELRGSVGIDTLLVDALERPVSTARSLQPVADGADLILTIDLAFQQQVEQILQRWIAEGERRRQVAEEYKQEYDPITNGVAIALDPRNGEILAMVSLPAYDNNVWVDPTRSAELQALLSPANPEAQEELARLTPLFNRAIAGRYPPGSSVKPFVGAVALQLGIISPETELRDPGRITLIERSGALFELPNSSRRDNGEIDISTALMVSSNVFFASIAGGNSEVTNLDDEDLRVGGLGIVRLAEGLDWFGFGARTGIRLAGEAMGLVPSPQWKSLALRDPWTTGDTYNAAIGQGYLEVTPLQLVTAMAGIAIDGTIFRPQIVHALVDGSSTIVEPVAPQVMARLPVDPAYLTVMREGMRRSVTEGLNVAARDECSGLSIAGKTGTAEFGPIRFKPDGTPTRQSHSWFVGFAPYDDPQIAVVVLLEGTGDLNDGSATLAVPAVTQIMQAYFGITPPAETPRGCPVLPQ